MNLKSKIIELLQDSEHTFDDLLKQLDLTEAEFDSQFDTKTIEIRTLELISKELRIPLYSFFRDKEFTTAYGIKESYYDVNIWSSQELKLKTEIKKLKATTRSSNRIREERSNY